MRHIFAEFVSGGCVIVVGKNHIKSHFENSIFKWNVCFLRRHLSLCGISSHCSSRSSNRIASSVRMHCIFKAQKVIEFYTLSFKNPISKRKIELGFLPVHSLYCKQLNKLWQGWMKISNECYQKWSRHSFMPRKKGTGTGIRCRYLAGKSLKILEKFYQLSLNLVLFPL